MATKEQIVEEKMQRWGLGLRELIDRLKEQAENEPKFPSFAKEWEKNIKIKADHYLKDKA